MKVNRILSIGLILCMFLTTKMPMLAMHNPNATLSKLIDGIGTGDTTQVIAAINAHANVNQPVAQIGNPLMFATRVADTDMIGILLNAGANIDGIDTNGKTALFLAAGDEYGQKKLAYLLRAQANAYHKDYNGHTALIDAALLGRQRSLQILLEYVTRLTENEKSSLKNWLLAEQRLRQGFQDPKELEKSDIPARGLPKDLRRLVAQYIYHSLANDIRQRVIRAGGQEALDKIKSNDDSSKRVIESVEMKTGKTVNSTSSIPILENYLNFNYLERRVWEQLDLPGWVMEPRNQNEP